MKNLMLLCLIFFLLPAAKTKAAVLYAGSPYEGVEQEQTFVVEWFLDTEQRVINTLSLKLKFTGDTLNVLDVSSGGSLIDFWLKAPVVNAESGTIELIGGSAGGLNGERIPIIRTSFQAKKQGRANIVMDQSSSVLLSDGRGTPDRLIFRELNFVISPPGLHPVSINSPTHPDQNSWYTSNDATIKFDPRPDEEYSYSFSSNLDIFPDEISDEPKEEIIYENLPDDIYYFKLNSRSGDSNWQEAVIFRVQIDATPPEEFTPQISSDPSVYDGKSFLVFSTVDKTSGISHYKIRTGLVGGATITQGPYILTARPIFGNDIQIEAVDQAGNSRIVNVPYKGLLDLRKLSLAITLFIGIGLLIVIKKRSETKN